MPILLQVLLKDADRYLVLYLLQQEIRALHRGIGISEMEILHNYKTLQQVIPQSEDLRLA